MHSSDRVLHVQIRISVAAPYFQGGCAGIGVGDSGLLAVPEVLRGPVPVYHCRLAVRRFILPYSTVPWPCLLLAEAFLGSTCPHGDGSAIRPVPLALLSHSLSLLHLFCFFASGLRLISISTQLLSTQHQSSALRKPLLVPLSSVTSVREH
jgi:hypothetical protein